MVRKSRLDMELRPALVTGCVKLAEEFSGVGGELQPEETEGAEETKGRDKRDKREKRAAPLTAVASPLVPLVPLVPLRPRVPLVPPVPLYPSAACISPAVRQRRS